MIMNLMDTSIRRLITDLIAGDHTTLGLVTNVEAGTETSTRVTFEHDDFSFETRYYRDPSSTIGLV